MQGDDETIDGPQRATGTGSSGAQDVTAVRRRRRTITAVASGALVAGLVAVTGVTVHRLVDEPVPLEPYGWSGPGVQTHSSALCGGIGADDSQGPRHLVASFRLDNVSDGTARIDRIAFDGVHGTERFDLSAAVVPPAETDHDVGNVVGDEVTAVAQGVHLERTTHLDVPRGDGVLLVVDMQLDREVDHGGAPRREVSWTGALGLPHDAVLPVGVGATAYGYPGSCADEATG